ncbi:MAG: acyltransferase, partial [Syntrophales bacterium]
FIFLIKLLYYKVRFRHNIVTSGIWYGFEKDFKLRIEENGMVILGRKVYFSKRTDIIAIGGKIIIGENVSFNKDCTVVSRMSIKIGSNCQFGEGVSIYDHNHNLYDSNLPISKQGFSSGPIEIGNNVWMGGKVFIKSNVKIGDNVVIGANSVVTKDIPSGMIAHGNPANHKPNSDLLS